MKLTEKQINLQEEYEQNLRERARLVRVKNLHKEIIWEYENIIIGGSIRSVFYALENGFPIIIQILEKPTKQAKTKKNQEYYKVYEGMIWALGLSGLNLVSRR